MKLGVCAQVLHHLPMEEGLALAAELGFSTIELPVDGQNPWVDLAKWLDGDADRLRAQVEAHGLTISALSNHQEGQLLLGPHGEDTDGVCTGSPAEKVAFATRQLIDTAELSRRLGVQVVCGFVGCPAWHRTFPWPLPDGWERGWPVLRERFMPVLDAFARRGVRFAHECHPIQQMYDLETALIGLETLDHHDALAFNFDPANLMLADIDPVAFVVELGSRIAHVHAKDGERVRHVGGRSGVGAHGRWDRPGRGFRFRIPGWGDLNWKHLVTELHLARFNGTLCIEHEDPTMSRREGLVMGLRHLKPLLLNEPVENRWW